MNKKLWIYISIIVILISLFPSILTAKAEEEGGTGDIPDRTYSFENAPFPGTYGKITESSWQQFIQGAQEKGHTMIKQFVWRAMVLSDGRKFGENAHSMVFFSTDGSDLEEEFNLRPETGGFDWKLYYKDPEKTNILKSSSGYHNGDGSLIWSLSWGYKDGDIIPVGVEWIAETWYRAELSDDPYQEKPEKYNIDDENNYGMWFKKPSYGELINIPRSTFSYRDWIEIEIQIPREYVPSTGQEEELFKVYGNVEKAITPNFAIKMYANNVGNIYGSYIVGHDGIWIFPKDIKYDKIYKNGTEIIGAKFIAKVPVDHIAPEDGGSSLIVADLYIIDSANSDIKYNVRIPEARTWTRYQTYVGVVDEDGDGFDDRTGIPIDEKEPDYDMDDERPDINDYDNNILGRISYYWDTLVYYVKLPFVYIGDVIDVIVLWIDETISSWIDSFVLIFERLFSFLPREVVVILGLGFATLMIITIIKAIRG